MSNLRGLIFASALLCAGNAHAFQTNMHTPTIHQLNPQPLPPGMQTGGGTGNVNITGSSGQGGGSGMGKVTPAMPKAGGNPLKSGARQ
jgi:hypothetical protein